MVWADLMRILVWTGAGAVLLCMIMFVDSLFTPYKDMEEMKKGNTAVTLRFVMKLVAQGYILSSSIAKSDSLWDGLVISVVSFIILLVLEWLVRMVLRSAFGLKLDEGTKEGLIPHALFGGSLHIVGALIIAACL
ncbi:DUF350 domain-containing protein [Paenibacillus selenitireducens]|uniref:DUF350 domain-containing protein n=1 Tax=Paenibacillus selenitireducens TaxID=1324314 RepID=A0A1T2X530_9BACL|nr:DUF350 domain-containing protein [Paenibacillus selenitireducens]OPA74796.1 DUF350 domain-containing protein [Paenibacillus selenitireducens]